MSIAPVESFPPVSEQSANVSSGRAQIQTGSGAAGATDSRTLSEQDSFATKSVPSPYELPQDVVEVHQDPDLKDQVIIQYLDQSKDVVLQVPSAEELSVERGIAQELQQAAKLHESAGAVPRGSEGEKIHGD
jgi:hypothetical protein